MQKTFLHVGCGTKNKLHTTAGFRAADWAEIRLDIDPQARPDIVGSMTDMAAVADASCDAVFSSHNIEHLNAHEVPLALGEFLRVLKPGGYAVITCPDLQSICALVAQDRLLQPAYTSPAGPISPLDMLYGLRSALARGNHFMAHRCGFTASVLSSTLRNSGFAATATARRPAPFFDLWAVAAKLPAQEAQLRQWTATHFPGAAPPARQ